jgi:hypothetical protein
MKYRKKPVVIEAIQFLHGKNDDEVALFLDAAWSGWRVADTGFGGIVIPTLEGDHYLVLPGDWIIKGAEGQFYPCKPDIFDETYEPAPEES